MLFSPIPQFESERADQWASETAVNVVMLMKICQQHGLKSQQKTFGLGLNILEWCCNQY